MRVKMTALSPIHIGTGDIYEPSNFVIDGDYLYFFKEEDFFKKLPLNDKKEFINISQRNIFQIWKFVSLRKEIAKSIYKYKVKISSGLKKEYKNNLGKPTQVSKDGREFFNQFQIQRSTRIPNKNISYIPGSSIKGAIRTALEDIFNWTDNNLYKEVVISDSFIREVYELIGYSLNKERFEDNLIGPKTFVEVIMSSPSYKSKFEFNLDFKRYKDNRIHISKNDIIEACKKHYKPLFDSMFEDEEIYRILGTKFKAEYENFKLKPNQFLLRIGKHSGARAVTLDRRKINVKFAEVRGENLDEKFAEVKGENLDEKLSKLIKKSQQEPEIIADLALEDRFLNEKEKKIQDIFWDYYESIENSEPLKEDLEKKKLRDIKGVLKEETTTWVFGYKHSLQENSHLPFGWVLCEILN